MQTARTTIYNGKVGTSDMLTQRLAVFLPEEDEANQKYIEEWLRIVKENPNSCHEIWLTTALGYPTLERHREIAVYYKQISEKFRSAGIRVSLQINNTLGHGDFIRLRDCSGLVNDHTNIETMMSPSGATSPYCFCWRGEKFIQYNKEVAAAYAEFHPYRIWFDDDLRAMNHHPVERGCFCDHCIEAFNKEYSHTFSRENLVYTINHGDISVREEWTRFIRDGLYRFTYEIAKAAAQVFPDVRFGLQYGPNRRYTGYGYNFLFDAMRDASGKGVGFRPGGGAFDDNNPSEFIRKARILEWQMVEAPDYIEDIRPEIECIPDVAYGKSANGIVFESDLYFAYGATAMSYAMMNREHEPLSYHAKEFALFSEHSEYWKRLSRINMKTKPSGIEIAVSKKSYLRPLKENEADFRFEMEYYDAGFAPTLGMPLTFRSGDRNKIYCLTKENTIGLSEDDILDLLSHPVFADGKSIQMLMERGFDVFGVEAYETSVLMLSEEFLPCAVNEGIHAPRWDKLNIVEPGFTFLPKSDKVTPISQYFGANSTVKPLFPENKTYPYGIAAFTVTTPYGGTWTAFGNHPFVYTSLARRNQFFSAMDLISAKKSLKAKLLEPLKAIVLPRVNKEDKVLCVSIVNTTVGQSGELTLLIRNPESEHFSFQSGTVSDVPLAYEKKTNAEGMPEYFVHPPTLPGWSVGTVFCAKESGEA